MKTRLPRPFRHAVWLILLFLLAPIHFIHLLPHFSTHILGDGMDAAEYPLNEWWTAHALLDLKTNPFQNKYQFHPLGLNMVHHTYNFIDGLLYTLFRPLVPLLVFHNALTWVSVFVNSLAAYFLLFSLTRLTALAFIGALAFAHSPVLTSYFGPQSLIEPYFFVFFVLASYPLFKDHRYGRAIGAGILLGLSVYNYPYYFVAGLAWWAVLVAYHLFPWTVKGETEEQGGNFSSPGRVLIASGLGLTVILVLIPKELWEMLKISRMMRTEYLLFLMLLVYIIRKIKKWNRPSRFRWAPPSPKEAAVVLLVSGLVLVTAVLVAFPYTRSFLTDEATRSAIKSLPEDFVHYSVDLTGFFAPHHPWLSRVYQRIALDWNSGRPMVATPAFLGYLWIFLLMAGLGLFSQKRELRLWVGGWSVFLMMCLGPYLKIHGIAYPSFLLPGILFPKLPLLESTRTLSRFLVPLVLFTIIVGCLILKELVGKAAQGRRTLLFSGLLLLVGFELALWPTPYLAQKTNYQVPQVYQDLAERAKGKAGVLLDLPLFTHSGTHSEGGGETRTHYYQTVHQQQLIGGISSKLDDSVFTFFQQLPGINSFWAMNPVSPDELAAALATLEVDWIVLNKTRVAADPLNAYLSTFRQTPYLHRFYEDQRYLGLRVDQQDRTLKERAWAYRNRPGP